MLAQSLGWEGPLSEGTATQLQCSCLENPMDRGAWRTEVHSVTWSQTRLKCAGTPEGFPCGSGGKESACNAGDLGLIPGSGRSPGEGIGYPLQNPGLENSMDCIVYGVAKSQTQLSGFHTS